LLGERFFLKTNPYPLNTAYQPGDKYCPWWQLAKQPKQLFKLHKPGYVRFSQSRMLSGLKSKFRYRCTSFKSYMLVAVYFCVKSGISFKLK
jgi:hypothetical protein